MINSNDKSLKIRKFKNRMVNTVAILSGIIGLAALAWILLTVIQHGLRSFNFSFFTELPTPPGIAGGGMANAILGTVLMTFMAAVISLPLGLLGGIYLSEFGRGTKFAESVRFMTNVLIGVPSIIVGVFVYVLIVVPTKQFSGFAGATSLAIIMLPIVVRTTEDILRLVPDSLRESGLALGAQRWRVTVDLIFREAKNGLMTGVLLAVARVSGETAPLLFTALNSPYWLKGFNEPVANLTVNIFNYAMSPYRDWQQQAWGASLLITLGVLTLTIVARVVLKQGKK